MRWSCLSIYGKELEFSSPLEYYQIILDEALDGFLDRIYRILDCEFTPEG